MFPWSQLHDVTLVLLCVSTVTVLTLPTVYYFLFRRTRLSFTMVRNCSEVSVSCDNSSNLSLTMVRSGGFQVVGFD